MVVFQFAVEDREHGQRLDHILRTRFPNVSQRVRKLWFAESRVRLSGKLARKGELAERGQLVVVAADADRILPTPDVDVVLDILFESEDIVVVNKPAGMPCVPLREAETGTVVNGLLARYPSMSSFGYSERDAGLVHRLDSGTSGVLVAAKSSTAFDVLVQALKRGELHKSYLAWCTAQPKEREGNIVLPLRPAPRNQRKVEVVSTSERDARPSHTHFRVLKQSDSLCVIRAEASVATRHQVRAHLASLGCPLLGDTLYGGSPDSRIQRHALHAERVTFRGCDKVGSFDCTSPLPPDLVALGLGP